MTNGAIVYRGPSQLTGDPIVVALTGLTHPSKNDKTGPMVQAWILRDGMPPTEAVKTGQDDAICGDCRHRSGSNIGRSCYVIWWQGPAQVYKALPHYPHVHPGLLRDVLGDKHIRFGAYGDPAAAPTSLWVELAGLSRAYVGYTHHWTTCDQQLRLVCMASVDTLAEKHAAAARGWRTFRVRQPGDAFEHDEVMCPASHEAGYTATCNDCRLCGGLSRNAKSVAILPHGQRVKWLAKSLPGVPA